MLLRALLEATTHIDCCCLAWRCLGVGFTAEAAECRACISWSTSQRTLDSCSQQNEGHWAGDWYRGAGEGHSGECCWKPPRAWSAAATRAMKSAPLQQLQIFPGCGACMASR
jgi:hypothetical protein